MAQHAKRIRNAGIAAIIIGVIVAAGALLLSSATVSNQLMPINIDTGEPPPPAVTRCASALSTGSAYASTDAGTDVLDCPAMVSRRRWVAGAGGVLALAGIAALIVSATSKRRDRRDESADTTPVPSRL